MNKRLSSVAIYNRCVVVFCSDQKETRYCLGCSAKSSASSQRAHGSRANQPVLYCKDSVALLQSHHSQVFHHQPDGENGTEFVATREQMLEGKQEIDRLLFDLERGAALYGSQETVERLVAIAQALRGLIGFSQAAEWFVRTETITWTEPRWSRSGPQEVERSKSASAGGWKATPLDSQIAQLLPEIVSAVVYEVAEAVKEGNSLPSLSDTRETQQAFEQAWLLYHWQKNKEKRDEQVITNLTNFKGINEYPLQCEEYKSALTEEHDELKLLTERASQQRNTKDFYCDDSGPGRVKHERELNESIRLSHQLPESHPMDTELSIQRYYKRRDYEILTDKIKKELLKAEIAESEKLLQLIKNDESAIQNHPVPQTIEDLLTPPPGLSQFARSVWIATQEQDLSKLAPVAQGECQRLFDFLIGLSTLCVALSVPEQRIIIPSNQYQPRKETKITYVMYPEKAYTQAARTLTHPRRSVADLVVEKERDLLDLAPYTAAYKLLPPGGGAPVKGILSTFPLDPEHPYFISYGLRSVIIDASHASKYSMRREAIETDIQQQRRGKEQKKDADDTPPSRRDSR